MQKSETFSVSYRQYLQSNGELAEPPPPASCEGDLLLEAYRLMALSRALDTKAIALQRTGLMGTYASCLGQEAVGTGIGCAMRADDVFVPYYRDQATQLARGISPMNLLQYWGGDERGSHFIEPAEDLPNCVPVATQLSHAAGVAAAIKIRHQKRAVVATCGDGATSRGDFYEALNLAGVWHLPLVVVINNNQWAISVRREYQSAATSLAQKAIAAGIPGEQVDGNDVIAVHAAVANALQRARRGKGAMLIEAVTYRLSDHTTADDASRYRPAEELRQAWALEPIKRLQTFLHSRQLWDADEEQRLQAEIQQQVQEAVDAYLGHPPQVPGCMFDYLFEQWPAAREWQRDALQQRVGRLLKEADDEH